jgi:hypothetical protein
MSFSMSQASLTFSVLISWNVPTGGGTVLIPKALS